MLGDRNRTQTFLYFVAGLAFCLAGTSFAQGQTSENDWPGWRGADRDDISKETGLMQEWPAGGPEQLWTVDTGGLGYAGFAVVDNRVYTLGSTGDSEFAICLDADDGSTLWKTTIDDLFVNKWGDGPRNTPTVDGDKIYVLSAGGALKCLNKEDGSVVWDSSLTEDYGGTRPYWGYSESPLIDGDKLICTPGGDMGSVLALNKETGKPVWQSEDYTKACHYSSVVAADVNGQRQYIQLFEKALVGFDSETGKVQWKQDWNGRVAVIPTPIFDDNKVYVSSGYGTGSMLVDISDSDNVRKLWFSGKMKNHHGGVILLDGHYFGYSDKVGWLCQSAETGGIVWRENDEFGKGAIAYADNRFYLLDERTGEVALIAASPDGWQEHGRFQLDPLSEKRKPDGAIWVHPVISNGKLFLRDQEQISCYDVSAK